MVRSLRICVLAALASLAAASIFAWSMRAQGLHVITARRSGPSSFTVDWRIDGDVDWLCSSATLVKSERTDSSNKAEVDVVRGPGWLMGMAANEWVFIGLPFCDEGADDAGIAILRGPTSVLIATPSKVVMSRINDATSPIMVAARRGDPSVKGKRGLIGVAHFKGRLLAFRASAVAGWCETPFEGAMPVSDPAVLESLWRCIVSGKGVADSVRNVYNLGVYCGGDLGVVWEMFDKR